MRSLVKGKHLVTDLFVFIITATRDHGDIIKKQFEHKDRRRQKSTKK